VYEINLISQIYLFRLTADALFLYFYAKSVSYPFLLFRDKSEAKKHNISLLQIEDVCRRALFLLWQAPKSNSLGHIFTVKCFYSVFLKLYCVVVVNGISLKFTLFRTKHFSRI